MNRSSRSRLVRALILFVAMVLVGGAAVDAYVWHRDSTRPRTVVTSAPVAIPVVTPTPTASAPAPIPVPTSSLVADVAVPAISVYGAPAVGKVLASVPTLDRAHYFTPPIAANGRIVVAICGSCFGPPGELVPPPGDAQLAFFY